MDIHSALDEAITEVRTPGNPDSAGVHAALRLALHIWQLRDPVLPLNHAWDLFGVGVLTAVDTLPPTDMATVILAEQQRIEDTAGLRRRTAELIAAVGTRLEAGAGDAQAAAANRRAWSAAAARLRSAAGHLASLP